MTSSPPYIKDEPEEFGFNPNKFIHSSGGMSHQFGGQSGDLNGVDPSNLSMSGNNMVGNFGQHLSGSFGMGNSGIADDDLEALLEDAPQGFQNYSNNGYGANVTTSDGNFYHGQSSNNQGLSIGHAHNGIPTHTYSHTPDNAPMASPFQNEFSYNQSRGMHQQSHQGYSSLGAQNGFDMHRHRKMQSIGDGRPQLGSLHIGASDNTLSQQALLNQQLHAQAKAASQQWDGTPGSNQSWLDSPLPSPHSAMHHPQISEIMHGKHASSLPAKVEGAHSASMPAFQSQEAKKKRRRESHNLVERRRRDNINERIQDLSRLVPQHRLEDEKVRKHINANGPMSPSGISPPEATSLLAGGSGRRAAAGQITTGLPLEEKDRGPNKGDILNGAVGWVRDCMWMLYKKEQEQDELRTYIEQLGGTWPFDKTEDDNRMQTELIEAVERNGTSNFHYSRGPGSGLRVPKHTNYAGDSLDPNQPSHSKLGDPGSTGSSNFWMGNHSGGESGRGSLSLKEEEEFGMDLG
jgi:hypothetical protein